MARPKKVEDSKMDRIRIQIPKEVHTKLDYYVDRDGMSRDAFIEDALERQFLNRSGAVLDTPLVIDRLNQLIDMNKAVTTDIANLSRIISDLAKSMTVLSRGENFLLDDEDLDTDGVF